MDKLKTNELSLGLDQNLRNDLVDNFKKLQDGVDGQADNVNAQIENMLGDVPLQDQNEVTQARIGTDGKEYKTLKSRLDNTEGTANTALKEERQTGTEVSTARTNSSGKTYDTLKQRLDSEADELNGKITDQLSKIDFSPEVFDTLSALQGKYPNGKIGLFIVSNTGHKYYWNGKNWIDGGIYQSVGLSDDEKAKIVDLANGSDGYVRGGNLLSGTTNDPYFAIDTDTNLSLVLNYNGRNWVDAKSSSTVKKYKGVGSKFFLDSTSINNGSTTRKNQVKFSVANPSTQTLNLMMDISPATSKSSVGLYRPDLSNGANKDFSVNIDPGKEVDFSFAMPSINEIKDKGTSPTVVGMAIYANTADNVNFLVTGLEVTPIFDYSKTNQPTKNEKALIDMTQDVDSFIKGGELLEPLTFGPYQLSSTIAQDTMTRFDSYHDKNWVRVLGSGSGVSYRGVSASYLVNGTNEYWRRTIPVEGTFSIVNHLSSSFAFYIDVNILSPNDKVVGSVKPDLSGGKRSDRTKQMMPGEETQVRFSLPDLRTITPAGTDMLTVVIYIMAFDGGQPVDMLVSDLKVVPTETINTDENPLSNHDKQLVDAIENVNSFIENGTLVAENGKCSYLPNVGSDVLSRMNNFMGKNWIRVTNATNNLYRGIKVPYDLKQLNSWRTSTRTKISFTLVNLSSDLLDLLLDIVVNSNNTQIANFRAMLNAKTQSGNKILATNEVHDFEFIMPAIDDLKKIDAEPSTALLQFFQQNQNNKVDFAITEVKVTPIKDDVINMPQIKTLPEFRMYGDTSGMTKEKNRVPLNVAINYPDGTVKKAFASIGWQGDSTLSYPKKNYKVKLFSDSNRTKKQKIVPFAGWHADNSFVLKANFIDALQIRNITSAQLAAQMTSVRSNLDNNVIGMYNFGQIMGEPVMVYINDVVVGLYTFDSDKNDKSYNMDESNTNNVVVSGAMHTAATQFKADTALLDYTDFGMEFPDDPTDTTKTNLNRLLKFVNSSTDEEFKANYTQYLNLESVVDYWLFVMLLSNKDAVDKNAVYQTWDGNVWYMLLYDMDSTWGISWHGDLVEATWDITTTTNKLFRRTKQLFPEAFKNRYSYLRTNVFRPDYIMSEFARQVEKVGNNAFELESSLWPGNLSQGKTNLDQVRQYTCQRIAYLDNQISHW